MEAKVPESNNGIEKKEPFDVVAFLSGLFNIRENTDQENTINSIKDDIAFKGHTSWILICSIFIASVGLNANSTAVVIGAMLISPLMGPILGIGMSLAINDIFTLRRSLKNFAVMVGLSVITAWLFFYFFPLRDASSELLARTAPDFRDVLIAFFGGLALIIAKAKKGTVASVIYGVAIATALMPPLCTVGFGLAVGNVNYAWGAFYLFIINTIFIALATFLVLKLLKFPMVRYANSAKRKRIAQLASLLAVLVMIPAGYTFYKVYEKSKFINQAKQFVNDKIDTYRFSERGIFLKELTKYEYNDENPVIELVFMGDEILPESVIKTWQNQKDTYSSLKKAELKIVQGNADNSNQSKYVLELYQSHKEELETSKTRIKVLEEEVDRLTKLSKNSLLFGQIVDEAKINYESIKELAFANELVSNFAKTDTLSVFKVKWKDNTSRAQREKELNKLTQWLKFKLKTDDFAVIEAN